MARKDAIKEREHDYFEIFVLPFFLKNTQPTMRELYFRFEKHQSSDILAQFARFIDNNDGNDKALINRIIPHSRSGFMTQEQVQGQICDSFLYLLKPAQALLENIKDPQAQEEILNLVYKHLNLYVDAGFTIQVRTALSPQSAKHQAVQKISSMLLANFFVQI